MDPVTDAVTMENPNKDIYNSVVSTDARVKEAVWVFENEGAGTNEDGKEETSSEEGKQMA